MVGLEQGSFSRAPEPSQQEALFVELAARSAFSLLTGASTPEALAERAAEIEMPALALTDLFDLGGVVRFTRSCDRLGVRPIVGAEIRVVPPVRSITAASSTSGISAARTTAARLNLFLLCMDREGYHNLCGLITQARLSNPRGHPVLEIGALKKRCAGLICLLGTKWLSEPRTHRAVVEELEETLPGRLWLALEHHGLPEDARRCAAWMAFSQEVGFSWAPINAPRYARPSDRIVHDVLTCIRHDTTLDDAGDRLLPNGEWYLKSAEQMRRRWCQAQGTPLHERRRDPRRQVGERLIPPLLECRCLGCEGLQRTVEIAECCTFRVEGLKPPLPTFKGFGEASESGPERGATRSPGRNFEGSGAAGDSHGLLRKLVNEGARRRYGDRFGPEHRRQLDHELGIIGCLGLSDYFLIIHDIVRFANERDILVQGRGSAANSAVCYCLGITAVDPVGLDLLFERFLSEERDEAPDIDLDIAHNDREEVLQYVYRKYGRDHAAMVCEAITYRGRMAVRDVSRVLGFSVAEADRLAAEADRSEAAAAADRLAEGGVVRAGLDPRHPRVPALIRAVQGLNELPRHRSIHVGGFVLSARPVGEVVPVEAASMPGRTVIQWDKDDLDLPGLIKVDLLGLGMLTVLQAAIRHIRRVRGVNLDLAQLPPDDPVVYDMICAADTVGVFQIESRAQMNTLPRVKPRCFYDLVIEVALIRPGPIQGDMVHPYLRRRNGEEPVTYLDPRLEPVLARTLGVPLFQEQGMKVAVVLAGFTPAQADKLRRAMGFKRSHQAMNEVGKELAEGLRANGVSPDVASQIFKQLTAFANYGFPESHSASFALLVYASAYLKRYYAPEFFAAMLNAQPMGFYAPATLIRDAQRHGVEVLALDLARSEWDCTLEPASGCEGRAPALRLGLRLVRGLGRRARDRLQRAVEEGAFTSVEDVVRRSGLERAELRVLAEAGAFRSLWPGRREALWELLRQFRGDAGPLAPRRFRRGRHKRLPRMSRFERVLADYRTLGLSAEGHPMEFVRPMLRDRGVLSAAEVRECPAGTEVAVAGLAITRQRPSTAKGIMFVTLEDETGLANFVVMPNVQARYREALMAHVPILRGIVESESGVVNVLVGSASILPLGNRTPAVRSRNFR
ncbi:MAG: error-prone DNA polymerase [Gemmatimonadales bacterium]